MSDRLKLWVGVLGMLIAICTLVFPSQHVWASSGGYPYASMPCVHAPYTTQGKGPRWCANYDWGQRRNDTRASSVISPYGYYYRNCTDYVAWKLAGLGIQAAQYRGLGDAKHWAHPSGKHELRVDSLPAVGAVGVRTSGEYGHVAFVEAVGVAGHPAGSITISEYNKRADGNYGERSGTPAQLGLTHFVHFEEHKLLVTPAAPVAPAVESPESARDIEEAKALPTADISAVPQRDGTASVPKTADGAPEATSVVKAPETPGVTAPRVTAESVPNLITPKEEPSPQLVPIAPASVVDPPAPAVTQPEKVAEPALANAEGAKDWAAVALPKAIPASTVNVPAIVLPAITAIPHQWWAQAEGAPPAVLANRAMLAPIDSKAVSGMGYWAIGGFMVAVVIHELFRVRFWLGISYSTHRGYGLAAGRMAS